MMAPPTRLEKPEDLTRAVYEELVTKQEKAPVSANEKTAGYTSEYREWPQSL